MLTGQFLYQGSMYYKIRRNLIKTVISTTGLIQGLCF